MYGPDVVNKGALRLELFEAQVAGKATSGSRLEQEERQELVNSRK
jgi:hypothetical protein